MTDRNVSISDKMVLPSLCIDLIVASMSVFIIKPGVRLVS